MAAYTLLDQAEEDALHKPRLLNVEEKPFKRITKRLLGPAALISSVPTLPPTPPPDTSAADEEAAAYEHEKQKRLDEQRQWREDVLLDFAAFESSIIRIQFLLTSNVKERERYAAERVKIEKTSQAVRDNTVDLRLHLEGTRKTLALRKEYDELADKITANHNLKPRDEQQQNLEKLNAEIEELEQESQDYARTWIERKEQFGKIMEEGMQLRRLIRDEKEEVDPREGMEGEKDGDDDQRGRSSGINTPRPDSADGATPMQGVESRGDSPGGLTVERSRVRGVSPLREVQAANDDSDRALRDDEDMAEDGELAAEPETTTAPLEGLISTELDENIQSAYLGAAETMDVT